MNNDEIRLVADIRPDAQPYDREAGNAARRRLAATAGTREPRWRRSYTMALAGALAVAVAVGTTVVVSVTSRAPNREDLGAETVVALPKLSRVSASEVLGRAARAARDELDPRDDQFVKVESQTMNAVLGGELVTRDDGTTEPQKRYLYRTRRVIWQSADGQRAGALKVDYLKPQAYPGWPIPKEAYQQPDNGWNRLPVCERPPAYLRYDYASLKKLPTDVDGMRAFLYTGERGGDSKDAAAWTAASDMLQENYMPAAQRAALFKAIGTIPGVDAVENAEDAAGRRGIGVGRISWGVREDLIFDPRTYEFLGERGVVVDEKEAQAPVGSLVASSAQFSVTVTDSVPEVPEQPGDVTVKIDGKEADCG
ncbi:CU044_5270 family protein [Streptosporangium sp. NPDC051023]|uniref:CU044_5270 family protein n=1 Tax=Streptosporangium sp. NPDC051023 TaxID=3155410 RepID=UPI00344DF50A